MAAPEVLYLDTARLGQTLPRACRASIDFARFTSEHGSTLYFEEFLRNGSSAWKSALVQDFPGLASWRGLRSFQECLKQVAVMPESSDVFIAARSAVLMRSAARLLFGRCRNVLTTDLSWPAYAGILDSESGTNRITKISLRREVLGEKLGAKELCARIADSFRGSGCDGLFLPMVDNLGIKLPIRQIVQEVRRNSELRFCVVDGAQAIGHVALDEIQGHCDFLVAGCHKWLRAGLPLGIGFASNPSSQAYVRDSVNRWVSKGYIEDPLLRFSRELEGIDENSFGETVNLSAVFSANAAAAEALNQPTGTAATELTATRCAISDIATRYSWQPVNPVDELRSRIVLIRPRVRCPESIDINNLRRSFADKGVAVTAYHDGMVRLSIPHLGMQDGQLSQFAEAVASASRSMV